MKIQDTKIPKLSRLLKRYLKPGKECNLDTRKISKLRIKPKDKIIKVEAFTTKWVPFGFDKNIVVRVLPMMGFIQQNKLEELKKDIKKTLELWIKTNRLKIEIEEPKKKIIKKTKKSKKKTKKPEEVEENQEETQNIGLEPSKEESSDLENL